MTFDDCFFLVLLLLVDSNICIFFYLTRFPFCLNFADPEGSWIPCNDTSRCACGFPIGVWGT